MIGILYIIVYSFVAAQKKRIFRSFDISLSLSLAYKNLRIKYLVVVVVVVV